MAQGTILLADVRKPACPVCRTVYGQAGLELAQEVASREVPWPDPPHPFGIIAGEGMPAPAINGLKGPGDAFRITSAEATPVRMADATKNDFQPMA